MCNNIEHQWKCISPGEYDFLYECVICRETHMESIDNPDSERPVCGCKNPKTERERWVKMVINVMDKAPDNESWDDVMGRVYDAGLAKMPEDK